MIRDEKPRPVAIFTRGSSGLYADDRGVTVDGPLRIRRFAWPDISHFADGIRGMDQGYAWVLNIVLRSGRTVPVPCTAGSPTPELLAAVRRLADVHGIPATLTGIMMKDGRPVDRGFYTDPGGRAGLRYWDGKRWSPLLRQKDGRGWSKGRQSAAFWAELPVAPEPWTYPAARVARSMAWIRVWALLTVALLVMGVAVGPAQYRGFTFSLFLHIRRHHSTVPDSRVVQLAQMEDREGGQRRRDR